MTPEPDPAELLALAYVILRRLLRAAALPLPARRELLRFLDWLAAKYLA